MIEAGKNKTKPEQQLFSWQVEDIFKEYYAPLCYFAARYLGDEIAAEDLTQDLFASLLEKKQEFHSLLHLKNFLYLSVRNACLNVIRSGNAKERYLAAGKAADNTDDSLIQNIIVTEVYKELTEAVALLPAECRKVFEACYFEGLDNEKAARKLGLSIFTVKAQKARGKKILKENLKDLFPVLAILFDLF